MIEIHKLQQYPASSPNRGEDGLVKSVFFGNAPRARLSSQSQNYAMRKYISDNEMLPDKNLDVRTRELLSFFAPKLAQENVCTEEQAKKVIEAATTILGYKTKDGRTDCLLFISKAGMDAFYKACVDNWQGLLDVYEKTHSKKKQELDKKCPVVAKFLAFKDNIMTISDAVCIGQHGRMVAQDSAFSVESSTIMAHAFSTHKSGYEFDFFTANDDLAKDNGAGMMAHNSFNAPCYYCYWGDDFLNLKNNLNGNFELAKTGMMCWAEAFIKASPSGKAHGFAHYSPAEFILATVRTKGQPHTLATSFTKAVTASENQNITEQSAIALATQWDKLNKMYEYTDSLEGIYYVSVFDLDNPPAAWKRLASIKELMATLGSHFKE